MANLQFEKIDENVETMISNATDSARRVLHAGFGAAAIARENVTKLSVDREKVTNQLTERGQKVADEQRVAFNEFSEAYQKRVRDLANSLEGRLNKVTETVLTRLNIPTAESIDQLNRKVATLNRKVDKLNKAS